MVLFEKIQQMQQKLENAFLVNFFWEFRNVGIIYGILFNQWMPVMFLWKQMSSAGGKLPKSILNRLNFEIQGIKTGG